MKILITGATGLIGDRILQLCSKRGYRVHYLTTQKDKVKDNDALKGFYWNPKTKEIDINCLEGIDAVINLAGASVSKQWTSTHKNEIESSRIDSIRLLYKLLYENKNQVQFFSSASALGIYPSSYEKEYIETDNDINSSFLGNVVHKWEQEIDKIKDLNIGVSVLRIGIVLSKDGGALPEMIKPIKFGFGAAIGSGKQYQSWIHIEDLARMFLFVIEKKLSGTYNAVASNPVTNLEMTKAIAKLVQKPLWLPNIPNFVMKFMLGEMSALVLESQYLKNDKVKNDHFQFKYKFIEEALEENLK